jgi:hypothetical protein
MKTQELVKKLWAAASQARAPQEAEIADAYRYTYPRRDWYKFPGEQVDRQHLYDTTAANAATDLLTNIMNFLVPQNRAWASIQLRTQQLQRTLGSQFAVDLNTWNQTLFDHFSRSNFYLAASEAMLDSIVGGTGALAVYDDPMKPDISYFAVPLNQLYFLENHAGVVDVIFRCFHISNRDCLELYPNAPQNLIRMWNNAPTDSTEIVESCVPQNGEFSHCFYVKSNWILLEERTLPFPPIVVWRWEKTLGEIWGESPIKIALPNIRTANIMVRDMLTSSNFAALPLMWSRDLGLPEEQLKKQYQPGGFIVSDEKPEPINMGQNLSVNQLMLESERAIIRKLLFDMPFPQNPNQNTYMTATEVNVRREMFYRSIGQPALRLLREFLQPLTEQVVFRLVQRGEILLPPPEVVLSLGDEAIQTPTDLFRVDVNAAIQRALKAAEANQALQSYQNLVAVTQDPNIVNKHIDVDGMIRKVLEGFSFPPELIRTPQQVKQIEQAQQQAQMQQAALMMQMGQQQGQPQQPSQPPQF